MQAQETWECSKCGRRADAPPGRSARYRCKNCGELMTLVTEVWSCRGCGHEGVATAARGSRYNCKYCGQPMSLLSGRTIQSVVAPVSTQSPPSQAASTESLTSSLAAPPLEIPQPSAAPPLPYAAQLFAPSASAEISQGGRVAALPKWRVLGPLIAMAGGLVGLLGSAVQEATHGGLFGPFIAGPMIEEALKPAGVYLLLAKWPQVLTSRRYTALLSALAGLTFGVIENLVYLYIYFPEHSPALVLWRYTAGLALHTGCSFMVGFGINKKLMAAVNGEIPFLSANKRFFIIPMIIHSLYNTNAFVLATFFHWKFQ